MKTKIAALSAFVLLFLSGSNAKVSAADNVFYKDTAGVFSGFVPDSTASAPKVASVASSGKKAVFAGFPKFTFSDDALISDYLIKAINASQVSIDAALFGVTLSDVATALIAAQNRGVSVRIVMNQNHVFPSPTPDVQRLIDSGIAIRSLRGTWTYGVQHNKIAVFDGQLMLTGSYNWTYSATNFNYENVMFTQDKDMVRGYWDYFKYMWENGKELSSGPSGEIPYGSYAKPPSAPAPSVPFYSQKFPIYSFSPMGGTEDWLLSAVNSCKKSLELASYTISSMNLAKAIIDVKAKGVKVRVLTDKIMGEKSNTVKYLINQKVEVRWMVGRGGKGAMHNKYAVFDGALMESGSHNWTTNAEINDFENIYFSADPAFVSGFQNKFNTLFNLAQPALPGNASGDDSN